MKYVAQKDDMGCGVACVANRFGMTYQEALCYFVQPELAKTAGYKCKFIVKALKNAGIDARLKHIDRAKPLPDLPIGSIVLLEKSEEYPFQHYLLKAKNGWVDPWINMHENSDVRFAKADLRASLPGRAYYAIVG